LPAHSSIAEEIAAANGLTPVVTPTKGRHLRVVQSNVSDAQFLKELAAKARYKEQESGQIVPSFERSEGFHEEPRQEPAQDLAEGRFKEAELRQVEAVAVTIGLPCSCS